MPLTLLQYADYLDTRELSWPVPPAVKRPKAKPHLSPLRHIRAVVWSVYGTLLNISGGELWFEHPDRFVMDVALDKTVQEFKMWCSMTRKPGQPAEYLRQLYGRALDEQKAAPSPGEKYPEILSEKIWENIIQKLFQKDYNFDVGFYGSLNEYSRKVAYFFHASLQGTACYDGAAAALKAVADAGLRQGLLDNGQVFTIVQLQRGLRKQDAALDFDHVIDPKLRVFSYQHRARKPGERLFRNLLGALSESGIGAGEVLYVGSSLARDIAPAKRLGMHTALFAGDRGSLQATKELLKDSASRPDVLLTELPQISEVVATE